MWNDVATLGLGLLGIAGSANWLAGRSARHLRALKLQAEVLELLPPGSLGKALMRDVVEMSTRKYVANLHLTWTYRWVKILLVVGTITLAGALTTMGCSVWRLVDSTPPEWTVPAVVWGVIVMTVGGAASMVAVSQAERSVSTARDQIERRLGEEPQQ